LREPIRNREAPGRRSQGFTAEEKAAMRERAREQKAAAGEAIVPWARDGPNPVLVEWTRARALAGEGRRALVVGTGLGDDAEHPE
jgi:hypothetical protein